MVPDLQSIIKSHQIRKKCQTKLVSTVSINNLCFAKWHKNYVSTCIFLSLFWQNVTANHRVNDAVFTEDSQQVVTGRFMYGPLDMVTLAGEKVISLQHTHRLMSVVALLVCAHVFCNPVQVDLHIMTQPPSGEWMYFNTEVTNSSGRVSFIIPEDKCLGIGVYPVKMVVRWD